MLTEESGQVDRIREALVSTRSESLRKTSARAIIRTYTRKPLSIRKSGSRAELATNQAARGSNRGERSEPTDCGAKRRNPQGERRRRESISPGAPNGRGVPRERGPFAFWAAVSWIRTARTEPARPMSIELSLYTVYAGSCGKNHQSACRHWPCGTCNLLIFRARDRGPAWHDSGKFFRKACNHSGFDGTDQRSPRASIDPVSFTDLVRLPGSR